TTLYCCLPGAELGLSGVRAAVLLCGPHKGATQLAGCGGGELTHSHRCQHPLPHATAAIMQMYSKKDHSSMDCFICCLLSHGDKGQLKGTDWKSVPIKGLVSCFIGSNCKSLAGKPKLFFIQACQGTHKEQSISVEEDGCQKLETDACPLPSVPDWADILTGMATFGQGARLDDLPRSLPALMSMKSMRVLFQASKQMPEIISTLRRQLIF
uniref:Caspase family p20 domain-containing protein n=1 Tax=Crocodylus porosus TaxID=8502 RepID=A0A7M4ELJ1_CROPO